MNSIDTGQCQCCSALVECLAQGWDFMRKRWLKVQVNRLYCQKCAAMQIEVRIPGDKEWIRLQPRSDLPPCLAHCEVTEVWQPSNFGYRCKKCGG